MQVALDRVAQNRTTITIAHRLSTIKKADRIVVLKKGKVVEQGTHDSLIANEGGVYATLVNAQALSLGEPAEASDESVEAEDDDQSLMREKSHAKSEAVDKPKSKKTRQRGLFASFGRFFYESKSQWYLMIITLIFNACAAAGSVLQSWLFAQVVFVFKYTGSKLNSESEFWGKMWAVLATGIGLSYFGGFFASTRLATIVRAKYQKQYFESILFQKTSFFDEEDHSQGTMTSRAASDPRQLEELMGANMASVCISIFTIIGAVAIAFSFGWKLSFVGIGVVMPLILGSSYWRFKYELSFEKMNNEVFAESSKFASESIAAFRTVTSLTLEEFICQRFEKLCREHTIKAYKKARWVSLLFAFSDSATLPCQALLFFYGSRLLASGEYGIINYLVIMMATMQGAESAGQGLSFGPNAAQASAAANRMLDMRESRMNDEVNDGQKIPDSEGGMKIELRNLHFKYPTRDVPVFKGLNLTIEKGQFAALVGASGCGKTSIISLLERSVCWIVCGTTDANYLAGSMTLMAARSSAMMLIFADYNIMPTDDNCLWLPKKPRSCRVSLSFLYALETTSNLPYTFYNRDNQRQCSSRRRPVLRDGRAAAPSLPRRLDSRFCDLSTRRLQHQHRLARCFAVWRPEAARRHRPSSHQRAEPAPPR